MFITIGCLYVCVHTACLLVWFLNNPHTHTKTATLLFQTAATLILLYLYILVSGLS